MPKINVYLPDELATAVREAGIPVSSVCQQALADAVANADGPVLGPASEKGEAAGTDLSRFTKRAQTVIRSAQEGSGKQARRATSVHLVGAIVGDGASLAVNVLRQLDIDTDDLIAELRGLIHSRAEGRPRPGSLGDTCRAAVEQALALGHNYVGTEHLLLALVAGPDDEMVAATLHGMGADLETTRRTVLSTLAGYEYARQNLSFSGISAPIRAALEDIRQRLGRLESSITR